MEKPELSYPLTGARAKDSFYYVTADRWVIAGQENGETVRISGAGHTPEEWEQILGQYADRGYAIIYVGPNGQK